MKCLAIIALLLVASPAQPRVHHRRAAIHLAGPMDPMDLWHPDNRSIA